MTTTETGPAEHETAERAAWLDWRRQGIGASDVAGIVGLTPWASRFSVWADKLGMIPDEDKEIFEYGRRAEPMLAGYLADRTGLTIADAQALAVHPDHAHHRATLDGRVYETDLSLPIGVAEYKTTDDRPWAEVPDQYAVQVQWQMWCDEAPHAWIGTLHRRSFRVYQVPRDPASITMLAQAVDEFWFGHVAPALAAKATAGEDWLEAIQPFAPPVDATDATATALGAAYPHHQEAKTANLDALTWALDLRADATARAKAAKADRTKAENAIKAALADAEVGTVNGETVLTWRTSPREGYTVAATTVRTLRAAPKSKGGPK